MHKQAPAPVAADSNEEAPFSQLFQVQEDLTPVQALVQYGRSALPFQRLAYAQGIAAAAAAASFDDIKGQLVPLVVDLLRDPEADIRVTVLQQLPELGQAVASCSSSSSDQQQLLDVLLDALFPQLLTDDDEAVAVQAVRSSVLAFQQLVALLPPPVAAHATLRTIRKLDALHQDEASIQAVRVFAHAAASWPQAQLAHHIPPLLRQWGAHRDFSVREALACCMSLVGLNAPLDSWEAAILPCFQELCTDHNWRVRRAAAADLPRLAGQLHLHSSSGKPERQQQQQQTGLLETAAAAAANGSCRQRSRSSSKSTSAGWQPMCLPGMAPGMGGGLVGPLGTCCSSQAAVSRGTSPRFLSPRAPVPAPAATPGAAVMGSHPMRSSLIVDTVLTPSLQAGRSRGTGGRSSCPVGRTGAGQVLAQGGSPADSGTLSGDSSSSSEEDDSESLSHPGDSSGSLGSLESPPCDAAETAAKACPLAQQAAQQHTLWCWLRECMELLTADSSHWVKVGALAGLGPLLLLLPPCQLSQALVNRYLAMANSSVVAHDISVAVACARSFGAVVERVGAAAWPMFRAAWGSLQASRDPAVLQELVKALPGLSRRLDSGVVAGELLPALSALCHQHLSWLEGALAPLLGELMEALPPRGHDILLEVVPMLVASDKERCRAWRLRRTVAGQLTRMAAAVSPAAVPSVLWPAVATLCNDPVAAVRAAAAAQVGGVLQALQAGALQPAAGAGSSGSAGGAGDISKHGAQQQPAAERGGLGLQHSSSNASSSSSISTLGDHQEHHLDQQQQGRQVAGASGYDSDDESDSRRSSGPADSAGVAVPFGGSSSSSSSRDGAGGRGRLHDASPAFLGSSPWPGRALGSCQPMGVFDSKDEDLGSGAVGAAAAANGGRGYHHHSGNGSTSSSGSGSGGSGGSSSSSSSSGGMLSHPALVVVPSAPAAVAGPSLCHQAVGAAGMDCFDELAGLPCALSPPEEELSAARASGPEQQEVLQAARWAQDRLSDSDAMAPPKPAVEQPMRSALSSPGPSPPTSPPSITSSREGVQAAANTTKGEQQQQVLAHNGSSDSGSASSSSSSSRAARRVSFVDDANEGAPSTDTSSASGSNSSSSGGRASPVTVRAGSPAPGAGLIHPAMMPVGSWATRQVGSGGAACKRSQSAGDLTRSTDAAATQHHRNALPRHSSASRLGRSNNSSGGGASSQGGLGRALAAAAAAAAAGAAGGDGAAACVRDPKLANPDQYVDTLLSCFAASPSYQSRQLYVAMALSILANAGQQLTAAQQQQLWRGLHGLAKDPTPSVRQVVAAALAPLLSGAGPAGAAAAASGPAHKAAAAASGPAHEAAAAAGHCPGDAPAGYLGSVPGAGGEAPALTQGGSSFMTPLATISLVHRGGGSKGVCCSTSAEAAAGGVGGSEVAAAEGNSSTSSSSGVGAVEEDVWKLRGCPEMADLVALMQR